MDEIIGYQPLVNEIKELINKKQYQVLKLMNAETINLYWEIGEEIYRQQQEKGWGKAIVQVHDNQFSFLSESASRVRNCRIFSFLKYRNKKAAQMAVHI